MSGKTIMSKIIKTKEMFLAECQEELNTTGKVCVGWQLINSEGEQENCFHYYYEKNPIKGLLLMGGLEFMEINRPGVGNNSILFI